MATLQTIPWNVHRHRARRILLPAVRVVVPTRGVCVTLFCCIRVFLVVYVIYLFLFVSLLRVVAWRIVNTFSTFSGSFVRKKILGS